MKKKLILSITFIVSLSPMLLSQYGGCKGVQEIPGLINLFHPIGILSVLLFAIGVWMPFKHAAVNKAISASGAIGNVISEIYQFFTWHIQRITRRMSIKNSIRWTYPGFYIGLAASIVMVAAYFVIDRSVKDGSIEQNEELQQEVIL